MQAWDLVATTATTIVIAVTVVIVVVAVGAEPGDAFLRRRVVRLAV